MDKISSKIVGVLERVESRVSESSSSSRLSTSELRFLRVDVRESPDISVSSVPAVVYFRNGKPEVYDGGWNSVKPQEKGLIFFSPQTFCF